MSCAYVAKGKNGLNLCRKQERLFWRLALSFRSACPHLPAFTIALQFCRSQLSDVTPNLSAVFNNSFAAFYCRSRNQNSLFRATCSAIVQLICVSWKFKDIFGPQKNPKVGHMSRNRAEHQFCGVSRHFFFGKNTTQS